MHKKLRAYYFGLTAEYAVMLLLTLKGYRILGRRLKTPMGEIDLLARTRSHLVVVEVKARRTREAALYAITPHQQQRLKRGIEYIRAAKPQLAPLPIRFDCCTVTWYMHITHLKHAFM